MSDHHQVASLADLREDRLRELRQARVLILAGQVRCDRVVSERAPLGAAQVPGPADVPRPPPAARRPAARRAEDAGRGRGGAR